MSKTKKIKTYLIHNFETLTLTETLKNSIKFRTINI